MLCLHRKVIYQTLFQLIIFLVISSIRSARNEYLDNYIKDYRGIAHHISMTTSARVHFKGSIGYNTRRKVSNGLCKDIFPDLIVLPKTTKDVAQVVIISRYYNVPITVRSGGHSFLCTSTKRGKNLDTINTL